MTIDRLTLRSATPADASAIRERLVELGDAQLADEPRASELALALAQILADDARHTWLAEAHGQVVGLMTLSTRPRLRLAGLVVTVHPGHFAPGPLTVRFVRASTKLEVRWRTTAPVPETRSTL